MLLVLFIFFVKIEFLLCLFENKSEQDLFYEINRQRKTLGLSNVEIHLTLQLAAQKRCANQEQLIKTYQTMLSNTYKDDNWPKQEQLHKIFLHGKNKVSNNEIFVSLIFLVIERIYLNGINIHENVFHKFLFVPNIYQKSFVYIGIARHEYTNFSAQCILFGSFNNPISNHHRRLRLLYILISGGIFLLTLIICSIINDQRQFRLKQPLEQEIIDNRHAIISKNSMNSSNGIDRRSLAKHDDTNRMTIARLGSLINERSSAVHSFFKNPK